LRKGELYNLKVGDVVRHADDAITVTLTMRKTLSRGAHQTFTVPHTVTDVFSPVPYFAALCAAREEWERTNGAALPDVLLMTMRDGHIVNLRVGENKLASLASEVAYFNNLPNARTYTSHCFRRTGATTLANAGASAHEISKHLGHSHLGTAMHYVAESAVAQSRSSERLAGVAAPTSSPRMHAATAAAPVAAAAAAVAGTSAGQVGQLFASGAFSNCSIVFNMAPAAAAPGNDATEPAAKIPRG
jgi:integrase